MSSITLSITFLFIYCLHLWKINNWGWKSLFSFFWACFLAWGKHDRPPDVQWNSAYPTKSILLRNVFFCLLCTHFPFHNVLSCGNPEGLVFSWSVWYAITLFFLSCLSVQLWHLHCMSKSHRVHTGIVLKAETFHFVAVTRNLRTYVEWACLSYIVFSKSRISSLKGKSKQTCKNTPFLSLNIVKIKSTFCNKN